MTRTSSLCCIALGLGLFGYAWASSGAGAEAESSVDAQAPTTSLKVAEIAYPDQRLVAIYETGDGGFSYVQSGPYGTHPMPLPDDLAEHGDPIRAFQALAPDQAIPGVLRRAVKRAEAVRAMAAPAETNGSEAQEDQIDDAGGQFEAALSGRDTDTSGPTGQSGCPEWWFNQASGNGQLFCPNEGKAACYKWVNWAYYYDRKGWKGYGAVCTDSGTAIFQTTIHQTVDTFWVEAGTWRFVQYYPYRSCGWFSCSDVRVFQKFELLNGSAVAHFGAQTY